MEPTRFSAAAASRAWRRARAAHRQRLGDKLQTVSAQPENRARNKRRILKSGLLGASLTLGFLVVVGGIYQHVEERNDLVRHPPPGELVDIGGFRLHIHCDGEGAPTVIVETGYGDYSISWMGIQSSLTAETRFCIYDRAGVGWSESDTQLPTKPRVAENLTKLLLNSGENGPYVLVGHSWGGVLAREYAASYPEQIAGLVLVDSAHESQWRHLPDGAWPELESELNRRLILCRLGAPLGMVRLLGIWEEALPASLPEEVRGPRIAALNRRHHCAADSKARIAMGMDLRQSDPPRRLGDIPLIVLTRGAGEGGNGAPTDGDGAEWEATWLNLQRELAALSTNSEHRIVEAGHNIHLQQPSAVVDAIRELVGIQ